MEEELKKLIEEYRKIIYGNDNYFGMMSCLDPYYNNSWDEDLEELENKYKELI